MLTGHAGVARVHQRPPGRGDRRYLRGVQFMMRQVHRGLGHVRPRVGAGQLGAVVAGDVQETILSAVQMLSPARTSLVTIDTGVYWSQPPCKE